MFPINPTYSIWQDLSFKLSLIAKNDEQHDMTIGNMLSHKPILFNLATSQFKLSLILVLTCPLISKTDEQHDMTIGNMLSHKSDLVGTLPLAAVPLSLSRN